MAQATMIQSRLQLYFEQGIDDETGDIITKTKSFNNVKTSATPEQLLNVADTLASLQQHPLYEVRRNDVALLTAI